MLLLYFITYVHAQSCNDAFAGFSAMQILPEYRSPGEDPPLMIGTDENMDVQGLGIDLTGIWWMEGNPSSGTLASFAGASYDGDGSWPKTLSVPMNEAGHWSFDVTQTGQTMLYLNLFERVESDMVFTFTDDKFGQIEHWSVVTRISTNNELADFVGTDDSDTWVRPLPEVGADASYSLKRVLNADGTPTAYWGDFLSYYSGVSENFILMKYGTDSTCFRQCSMVRSCDNCTIACQGGLPVFQPTQDEVMRVLGVVFVVYLRSPQSSGLCTTLSTTDITGNVAFFQAVVAEVDSTLMDNFGFSAADVTAMIQSITSDAASGSGGGAVDISTAIATFQDSMTDEEFETLAKSIITFDQNCRASMWEIQAPRDNFEKFEEAMTPIIFGMAAILGRQVIFRWLREVAGQDVYPFRFGFSTNSWETVSEIAMDPTQLRENYIGAVPGHPQCFRWNVPILLSSTNPEHARTRAVLYPLLEYDPNELELGGDARPSIDALKNLLVDNLWYQLFHERLPTWDKLRVKQYIDVGAVCGLGEYAINFLASVDSNYAPDNIEFLRDLITLFAGKTDIGKSLGDDLSVTVDGFLFAGVVGTWHLLSKTWGYLSAGGTDALSAFDADPLNFVKESARFDPPVTSATSLYKEDTEMSYNGKTFTIPAGTPLQYMIAEANFDATVFDDPATFNPLRDESNILSWNGIQSQVESGSAPRGCPGYEMSSNIVKDILQHFRPSLTDTAGTECVDNYNEIDAKLMNAGVQYPDAQSNRCAWLTAYEGECPVDICCESCPNIEVGDFDEEILAHRRYIALNAFQGRIFGFDLTKETFNDYLSAETYWTEDVIVTIPVAGYYKGKESIVEYFLLQNRDFSDRRHYFFPSYATVTSYDELSDTTFGVWQRGLNCAKSAATEIEECEENHFYSMLTFEDSTSVIPVTMNIEFERHGVENMVSSFRDNTHLCTEITSRCTGDSVQFESQEACAEFMNSLPMTAEDQGCPLLAGPTLSCRHTHLILTQSSLRPEIHCAHIGPYNPDPNGKVKCSIADCESVGPQCGDGCCDNGSDALATTCPMMGGETAENCPEDCAGSVETCVDDADYANRRGLTCDDFRRNFARTGKTCVTNTLLNRCCASCAELRCLENPDEAGCQTTHEPTDEYDPPLPGQMNSIKKLLDRGADATRFGKIGKRAGSILQQKKEGDRLHPDVKKAMKKIKRFSRQDFSQSKWNKMQNNYNDVAHHG